MRLSAHLLRVSTTRTDGGSVFGAVPKERWETFLPPDRQNRVAVGNYCMLMPNRDGWVLVNSGPGDKSPLSTDIAPVRGRSSLLRELRELGVTPKDISTVILTHLHSEHIGGATHCTSSGRVLPTFPNARYVVQRAAWEEAMHPNERQCRHYRLDDCIPIKEAGQLELVDGRIEVMDGVWVEPMPGPTAGHQIVLSDIDAHRIAFLGVLAPTLMHMTPSVVAAADWDPEATVKSKHMVIHRALTEQWTMGSMGSDQWLTADDLLNLAPWRLKIGDVTEDQLAPVMMGDLKPAAVAV
jgi:glyoxylase-like metal-dependent hydrolase (beta-lactamase superfamily II)